MNRQKFLQRIFKSVTVLLVPTSIFPVYLPIPATNDCNDFVRKRDKHISEIKVNINNTENYPFVERDFIRRSNEYIMERKRNGMELRKVDLSNSNLGD